MSNNNDLNILEGINNFENYQNKFPKLVNKSIKILILPSDDEEHAFYNGTLEVYDYLKNNIQGDIVEILVEDKNYKELSLHSNAHWIGVFLVTSILAPLFTDVLSSYIVEEINAKPHDEVDLTINVVRKDKTSVSFSYRGETENLHTLFDEVKKLSEPDELHK